MNAEQISEKIFREYLKHEKKAKHLKLYEFVLIKTENDDVIDKVFAKYYNHLMKKILKSKKYREV